MKNTEDKVLILNTIEVVMLKRAVAELKDSLESDIVSEGHKEILLNIEEKLNHLKRLN